MEGGSARDGQGDVSMGVTIRRAALIAAGFVCMAGPAAADKIKNPTAVFSGLDKITGRIVSFEVAVDETVQFGALQMTPRVCYTRPPTESPNTTTFLEVDEITLDAKTRRIFSGWMFAASPGLHGIEHPVYDIWLVDCKGGTEVIAEPKDLPPEPAPIQPASQSRPQPGAQPAAPAGPPQRLQSAPQGAPPTAAPRPAAPRFFPSNP
jgi:hypothetical protein